MSGALTPNPNATPTADAINGALAGLGGMGTNPGIMALLGMAGGFGQAAMPTPYKGGVPFGAAIGLAAQGAGNGVQQAYRSQLAQAGAQGQQIANIGNASALPVQVAQNRMLANFYANPTAVQTLMDRANGVTNSSPSAAPANSPASAPTIQPVVSAAFASIPDQGTRTMAFNAAVKAGLPMAAWPAWISAVHNESGWNLNQGDGKAGEIGPGQVMPETGQGLGYSSQQLRDPGTNLLASALYFGKQWNAAKGDPVGALVGYNTGHPGGAPTPGYLTNGMGRLAQWGYPGAANTGDPNVQNYLTLAQQAEDQANAADLANRFHLPVGVDAPSLRTKAQQYRAAALAGPTAAAQANAQLGAEMAQKGFRVDGSGNLSIIPGGPADPALIGQQKSAEAMAQAAADRTKLITTRAGVFDPVTGKEIYRQPEYHELTDPNTGRQYPAFVQPGDGGQLSITGGPPGQQNGTPPTALGPGQEDIIKHLADQYSNEDKQKYEGATNSLYQLDQQDKNIAALNSGGGWSATGAGNNARLEWAKSINSAFGALGLRPPMDPAKVGDWEDATKIQTQLAFAQAKQLGSREAQQVISMSRNATPGAENTPQGYAAISAGYREMNNREVDLYNFKTDWLQAHGGNLTGAETAFNNQFTPQMYANRAVSRVTPVTVSSPADMQKLLPGTVVTNGQIDPSTGQPVRKIVPPRPGFPPLPSDLGSSTASAAPDGGN
jgi:hypothetical protein